MINEFLMYTQYSSGIIFLVMWLTVSIGAIITFRVVEVGIMLHAALKLLLVWAVLCSLAELVKML